MNYLLDTHILVWYLFDPNKLSKEVFDIIQNEKNHIYFSVINLWEIQIKKSINYSNSSLNDLTVDIIEAGFEPLPLFPKHLYVLDSLTLKNKEIQHKDPFDKVLIAQAKSNHMKLITHDHKLQHYDEDCIMYI